MSKKNYTVVGGTILLFIIVISIILFTNNNKETWTSEILESENYNISMNDCNNRETTFPQESVEKLFDMWKELSDNGPWLGNNEQCYKTVTITFEKNNIIQKREILLIDDKSLVLNLNDGSRYYTNAENINKYLEELFKTY